jgi:glycine cleavage system H protein
MERSIHLSQGIKLGLIGVVAAVLVAAALPLFAIIAFSARLVLLIILAAAVVGMTLSPALRRWLASDAELALSYLGLRMPEHEMLYPRHTWARLDDDGLLSVGADDLAQKALGPVEAVELPAIGASVRQGEPLLRMRRGDRVLDLRAPATGTVRAINGDLGSRPSLVNEAPYGAGWAVRLQPERPAASRRGLKRGGAARLWMRSEIDRFVAALAPASAPMVSVQDGGRLVDDLHKAIDDDTWRKVKRGFFEDDRA